MTLMTLSFLFHWPFWCLRGCAGSASLPRLRDSSRRAVRTRDSVSSGTEWASWVCAGHGAQGGATGPLTQAVIGAPGLEASLQGPRPGHKRSENSLFHQGLKCGWSGAWTPSLTGPALGNQCFFKPHSPFLALSEGPQHRLLCTRVWGLLRG